MSHCHRFGPSPGPVFANRELQRSRLDTHGGTVAPSKDYASRWYASNKKVASCGRKVVESSIAQVGEWDIESNFRMLRDSDEEMPRIIDLQTGRQQARLHSNFWSRSVM